MSEISGEGYPWKPSTDRERLGARWIADSFELFLIPVMVCWLPLGLRWRAINALVRFTPAYRIDAWLAHVGRTAAAFAPFSKPEFLRLRALRALDLADGWRARLPAWWGANLELDLPAAQIATLAAQRPVLALTFHFGAGMPVLAALAARMGPMHFISAKIAPQVFGVQKLRYWHARFRSGSTVQVSRAPTIYVGGAFGAAREALLAGRNVAALIDIPPHQAGALQPASLLGRKIALPVGLANLAIQTQAHVIVFARSMDADGVAAKIWLIDLGKISSLEALSLPAAQLLDEVVRADPAAWSLWQHCADYFAPSLAGTHTESASPPLANRDAPTTDASNG